MAKKAAIVCFALFAYLTLASCSGNKNVFISNRWPDNQYAKLVPAPTAGTIGAISMQSDDGFDGINIEVTGMSYEEALDYIKVLKEAGFTEEVDEFKVERQAWDINNFAFYGLKADSGNVHVMFTNESITIGKDLL